MRVTLSPIGKVGQPVPLTALAAIRKMGQLALFSALAVPGAHAAQITVQDHTLYLSGGIEYGDQAQFDAAVKANSIDTVVLSSGGGLVDQALTMAHLIHDRGMRTAILGQDYCASACAMMFLAGKERVMSAGANLGLHSAVDQTGVSARGTDSMSDFLRDVVVAPLDIILAADITPPNEMYWLPADRRAEMGIETVE